MNKYQALQKLPLAMTHDPRLLSFGRKIITKLGSSPAATSLESPCFLPLHSQSPPTLPTCTPTHTHTHTHTHTQDFLSTSLLSCSLLPIELKSFHCKAFSTLKSEVKLREASLRLKRSKGFPGSSAGEESTCNAREPRSLPGSGRPPRERIGYPLKCSWASLVAQMAKNLPAIQETWVGKIPWRRAWQPTPVFLPGESPIDRGAWRAAVHGGRKESDRLSN